MVEATAGFLTPQLQDPPSLDKGNLLLSDLAPSWLRAEHIRSLLDPHPQAHLSEKSRKDLA